MQLKSVRGIIPGSNSGPSKRNAFMLHGICCCKARFEQVYGSDPQWFQLGTRCTPNTNIHLSFTASPFRTDPQPVQFRARHEIISQLIILFCRPKSHCLRSHAGRNLIKPICCCEQAILAHLPPTGVVTSFTQY